MTAKKQTALAILIPAIVAIIPAIFTYSQSMYEIRQKYKQTHFEAEAGYSALVTSVKELQDAAKEQHDQIIKLQTYLTAMEQYLSRTASTPASNSRASRTLPSSGFAVAAARPPLTAAPDLTEPAASFDSAAKAMRQSATSPASK